MNFVMDAEAMLRCHRRERTAQEAESRHRQRRLTVDTATGLPAPRPRWRRT